MTDGSFLPRMARQSRARVTQARARESEGALLARAMDTAAAPILKLSGFDLIAELKLRSPAEGVLAAEQFEPDTQLEAYVAGGAAAVSVLTEPDEFKGSLNHLEAAAAFMGCHGIPVMRKDFVTDPYQVLEARAAGAGGILIIITMVTDEELEALLQCARECGLFVLLEAFDADDLARMAQLDAVKTPTPAASLLSGVNSRDLRTLEVDYARFESLAQQLPRGLPAIAESGIHSAEQIREIAALGYSGALVGSALMQSLDPAQAVSQLLAAGRDKLTETRACS